MILKEGDRVDVHYYSGDHTAYVKGRIDEIDSVGLTLTTQWGDLEWFPHTAVQRVRLTEAAEQRGQDHPII